MKYAARPATRSFLRPFLCPFLHPFLRSFPISRMRLAVSLPITCLVLLSACAQIGGNDGRPDQPASQQHTQSAARPITAPSIPPVLQAGAEIIRTEDDGAWEKTLLVSFPEARTTLSTYDGLVEAKAVMNHAADPKIWARLHTQGSDGQSYLERMRTRMAEHHRWQSGEVVMMGTAADLDNLATVTLEQGPMTVSVLVTAGAKTNALRAGTDMSDYVENETPPGTINIILLTNARMTVGAMARAMITLTEAKTAALEDLQVPSSYTKNAQATGTGTDSIVVVSGTTGPHATYAGGHSLLGSLIGKAAYLAVIEALGKQNGFFLPGNRKSGQ